MRVPPPVRSHLSPRTRGERAETLPIKPLPAVDLCIDKAHVFEEPLTYAFSDPFSVAWLSGFAEVMAGHGASIMLLSVSACDPKSLDAVVDGLDGLVGLCGNQPAIVRGREIGLPTVYCTLTGTSDADSYVVIDDYRAGLASTTSRRPRSKA